MKKISELDLGFTDAENYKRRENKNLFNQIFIRNKFLDQLCDPAINFIVGEKKKTKKQPKNWGRTKPSYCYHSIKYL
jgi:hypothetical protein